jgi:hypothetical protein
LAVSRKRFCLVPPFWTLADCARHTCDDRTHHHLSRGQVHELELDGLIEWIFFPQTNREKGIVRIRRLIPVRGLSARIGETLAEAVRLRHPWALMMLSEIRGQPSSRLR